MCHWSGVWPCPPPARPGTCRPITPPPRVASALSLSRLDRPESTSCRPLPRSVSDALPSKLKRRDIRRVADQPARSEEHNSEIQSQSKLVCRLLLGKKKK